MTVFERDEWRIVRVNVFGTLLYRLYHGNKSLGLFCTFDDALAHAS